MSISDNCKTVAIGGSQYDIGVGSNSGITRIYEIGDIIGGEPEKLPAQSYVNIVNDSGTNKYALNSWCFNFIFYYDMIIKNEKLIC